MGLVAASATHLECVVYERPASFRAPELGDRGFQSNVEAAGVGHSTCEFDDGFECEGVGGHLAKHLSDSIVATDGKTPLDACIRPFS